MWLPPFLIHRGIFVLSATNLLKGAVEMEKSVVINAHVVNKFFGKFHALRDLSISVSQGEIFGFIGKNGAGKTTFMRIICGLMKPSSGNIEITKQVINISGSHTLKPKIGFLPQNVRFSDNKNAAELITFFANLKNADSKRSIYFASELELDMKNTVRNMSPGQQRKLQLVIATIGLPDILVLDEPTAGLDPVGVQQVREIIRALNRKGCTVFISSHVLMELDNLCSNVAIIDKGQLLYQGSCRTVYEIEIEDIPRGVIELLPEAQKTKCNFVDNKLIAQIERHEVPDLLQVLYNKNIKVFGVKPQGLEMLYNNLIKEDA
jgi:ABC-2 type transport system ATP-binding protein